VSVFARFLCVGILGFLVDVGLTQGLILCGVTPLVARPPAIATAMLVTWLANRRYAFSVKTKRSLAELLRYMLVAVSMALLNYAIYFQLVVNGVWPALAVTIATAVQTVFSFLGYRHFAFQPPDRRG
jgi:putative flippase GtrA